MCSMLGKYMRFGYGNIYSQSNRPMSTDSIPLEVLRCIPITDVFNNVKI